MVQRTPPGRTGGIVAEFAFILGPYSTVWESRWASNTEAVFKECLVIMYLSAKFQRPHDRLRLFMNPNTTWHSLSNQAIIHSSATRTNSGIPGVSLIPWPTTRFRRCSAALISRFDTSASGIGLTISMLTRFLLPIDSNRHVMCTCASSRVTGYNSRVYEVLSVKIKQ